MAREKKPVPKVQMVSRAFRPYSPIQINLSMMQYELLCSQSLTSVFIHKNPSISFLLHYQRIKIPFLFIHITFCLQIRQ